MHPILLSMLRVSRPFYRAASLYATYVVEELETGFAVNMQRRRELYETAIGFETKVPLLPGQTGTLLWRGQVGLFTLGALEIPEEYAPHFVVLDARVGPVSLFSSAHPIPALAFARRGGTMVLESKQRDREQAIMINVQNTSDHPRMMRAIGYGTLTL